MHKLPAVLALVALAACDDIAGPKPPQPTNEFVKVTTTLAKLVVQQGDTMRFSYSIENLTGAPLTLTTPAGCQVRPTLDQVGGKRMEPPPLIDSDFICSGILVPTVTQLAAGETVTYSMLLRGYQPGVTPSFQHPGYLLTTGHYDASVLVTANEIGGAVRSDWVRFEVK